MNTICNQLTIIPFLAAILGAIPLNSLAQLTVSNTSTYAGSGSWNWKIYIEADQRTQRQINCVEYHLHPTFTNPVQKICDKQDTKFALSARGWGTFTVGVQIFYKDGRTENLEHLLVFEQKTESAQLNLSTNNWAREIEPGWWEWGIKIEGTQSDINQIKCVEYTLHSSFPNRVRMICNLENNFELVARGWGTFAVGIKILLKNGNIREMSHQLKFR
jgi:transcription initiation factor IIF auxiliary subunit